MGCKAITPHLVSLASRLKSKPFHLVASHCQRDRRENVVRYLRSQGLPLDTPNVTVTSFGRHPEIKGNGYVPYYAVFDHHGKLVYHHMCGNYHGGDGLRMIEWVDDLLDKAPALYLGDEPFDRVAKLARAVESKKRLGSSVATIERRIASGSEDADAAAELERLYSAIRTWRDREMKIALSRLGTQPSSVLGALDGLADDLGKTRLANDVRVEHARLAASTELRTSLELEQAFTKATQRIDRLGKKRGASASIRKALLALEAEIAGHDVPIAATIRDYIAMHAGG